MIGELTYPHDDDDDAKMITSILMSVTQTMERKDKNLFRTLIY